MTTCVGDGCTREHNLLYFPEPRCGRHTTGEQRDLLADLDRRAPGIGIRNGGWPYGPNIDVVGRAEMIGWAEHHKLRYSLHGDCLHWLSRGRCGVSVCREDRNTHQWMDHVTGWTRDGKAAVLVAQPYGLFTSDIADLAKISDEWSLDVLVDGTSWYGHGTTFVQLARAGGS